MLSKVLSSAVLGIDAYLVEVEVDIASGLPVFSTVGLPDGAVKESKDRVKSAIKNCGYEFPARKITVNLAPADIKKEGTGFDLPIAIGIIAATAGIKREKLSDYIILGELSLDGSIKPIKGALSIAIKAKELGIKGFILPKENAREAAVVGEIDILGVENISELVSFLNDELSLSSTKINLSEIFKEEREYSIDFSEVKGQEHVKRALEVAVAGGHNIIMVGPPGSGKTMLAQRISTIIPHMSFEEALETTKILSVSGLIPDHSAPVTTRLFRSPHHTISDAGLIGGGQIPKPGEVSLAHNGVLFLDELPEFKKNVLEVLRQPMEDGKVTISRSIISLTFPARFMLVAAMNPCPCGYYTDPHHECSCTLPQIQRYRSKVSGPLLDRIDIHVEVPPLRYQDLAKETSGEPSKVIRDRIKEARKIQQKRFQGKQIHCNSQMTSRYSKIFCELDQKSQKLLELAIDRLGLSARAFSRILKIARTIADLEAEADLSSQHISEAIQYRSLDRTILM